MKWAERVLWSVLVLWNCWIAYQYKDRLNETQKYGYDMAVRAQENLKDSVRAHECLNDLLSRYQDREATIGRLHSELEMSQKQADMFLNDWRRCQDEWVKRTMKQDVQFKQLEKLFEEAVKVAESYRKFFEEKGLKMPQSKEDER